MVSDAEEMGAGHVLNGRLRSRDLYLYYSLGPASRLQEGPHDGPTEFARLPQYSHD